MRRQSRTLILVALQAAAVGSALALQHDDQDSHRHDSRDTHDKGGYSHEQTGHRRDTGSQSSHGGRVYQGSHNNFRDSGASVSIEVVTPNLVLRLGDRDDHVHFRSGYYHRDPRWRDDRFLFRFYLFDYDRADCAFSPFYYYPNLPGYLSLSKVDFHTGSVRFRFDRRVSWDDRDRLDRDTENAVNDLLDGVSRQDSRAIGRLVPSGYWVDVDPGIGKPYSMSSDDFYDLLNDMAKATDTRDYRVLGVEPGRDCARIVVEHEFSDPWGHVVTSYHRVTLDYVGDGYRIAKFETSRRRF